MFPFLGWFEDHLGHLKWVFKKFKSLPEFMDLSRCLGLDHVSGKQAVRPTCLLAHPSSWTLVTILGFDHFAGMQQNQTPVPGQSTRSEVSQRGREGLDRGL